MKTNKVSHHYSSNSFQKNIFTTHDSSILANISSTQRKTNVSTTKKNDTNKTTNKNILSQLYDDEFVIMINQLSTAIKNYYRNNNKNYNTIKNDLLNINETSNKNILSIKSTFNNAEIAFNNFYSSAKQIFKKMKIYRREKIINIINQTKKPKDQDNKENPTNNRNDNMKYILNNTGASDCLSPPSGNTTKDMDTSISNNKKGSLSINITQQNINNNINNSVNISNILINNTNYEKK